MLFRGLVILFIGMILIQSVLVSAFMLLFGEENSTLVVSIAEVVLRVLQCMFWVYIYRVYSMAQASQENL